jgi:hypothetical protein
MVAEKDSFQPQESSFLFSRHLVPLSLRNGVKPRFPKEKMQSELKNYHFSVFLRTLTFE